MLMDTDQFLLETSSILLRIVRLGARLIELDLHIGSSEYLRLAHGLTDDPAFIDRFYYSGIKEISTWLNDNSDEIILVEIEDRGNDTDSNRLAKTENPIIEYLGGAINRVYRPQDWPFVLKDSKYCDDNDCFHTSDLSSPITIDLATGYPFSNADISSGTSSSAPRMPTHRELLASGKQFIPTAPNSGSDEIVSGT